MRRQIHNIYHRILVFLHLSPLSLAEKCRIAFGTAVILVLALALSIPYIWMGQLTKKASLDAGRAKAETLMRHHFQLKHPGDTLAPLDNTGAAVDVNDFEIRWIRFTKESGNGLEQLSEPQRQMVERLKAEDARDDDILLAEDEGVLYSNYVRIFRATDKCINCHNSQASASPFGQNELIGAVVIQRPAGEIGKTIQIGRASCRERV